MPVTLERPSIPSPTVRDRRPRALRNEKTHDRNRRILIGLINNMPDAALVATERQFIQLLEEGGADYDVRLRLYALDSVERGYEARRAMQEKYHRVDSLRAVWHDALIVTGAEPRAPSLPEEVYWRELVGVFDLARARTLSTLFSCLAAHAAVLYWDAITRIPLSSKLSGVFAARVIDRHPLVCGLPTLVSTPHSRLNGLDETALANKGYETLIRSDDAGVDVFVKDEASLLVFIQGHPEYEADSLAREFRRDLGRYLAGQREAPPSPPANYFTPNVLAEAEALVQRARRERRPEFAGLFPPAALKTSGAAPWRAVSSRLFRNWLAIVEERKAALEQSSAFARWGK